MSFNKWLEQRVQNLEEGHPYLRQTSHSTEKRINRANEKAGISSGQPAYPYRHAQRQELLRQVEQKRPLRRSEFINLYGYEAWLEYVTKHGLPEDHKWADAQDTDINR